MLHTDKKYANDIWAEEMQPKHCFMHHETRGILMMGKHNT